MSLLPTIILVLVSLAITSSQETYSTKYDNVDVDVILRSERLLKRYMACVLDKGPCTADGRYFRSILPDALATNCDKCTEKMKTNVKKVSKYIMNEKPEVWDMFVRKYDSDNKYRTSFARFLNE